MIEGQKMQEYEKRFREQLNYAIDQYNYLDRAMIAFLEIFCFAVFAGIYYLFGYIIAVIIALIILAIVTEFGINFQNAPVKKEKLAEIACDAMASLIQIKKGTFAIYDGVRIANYSKGKHKELYKEFIKYYPELASKKLKSLAAVDITYTN